MVSSKKLSDMYEQMNPVQKKYYRKITEKRTPETALKHLGIKHGKVPSQIKKTVYHKYLKDWD